MRVQYWTSADIRAAINGQEDFVIINIANEPFGNNTTAQYVQQTADAIRALRTAGHHAHDHDRRGELGPGLVQHHARQRDDAVEADSQRNLLFSVHMYEVYTALRIITSYMQAFDDMGLPLVIGEFGLEHNGQNVDEATIMAQAQQRGNGYIAWSWSGNGGCCTFLDMASNFGARAHGLGPDRRQRHRTASLRPRCRPRYSDRRQQPHRVADGAVASARALRPRP